MAQVTPCLYGSLLWLTVSGCEYITDMSDLDVLFVCYESSNMKLLLDSLTLLDKSRPQVDGEILAPSGWASAWREVAAACTSGGQSRVLAKSGYEARLITLDEFFKGKVD
jgi:phosphoribosyl-dephospho-CoA transferase